MGEATGIPNPNDGMNDGATANDEKGALWGEEETASADTDDKATASDEGGSEVANDGGVDEDMAWSVNDVEGSENDVEESENDVEGSVNEGSFHNHLALEGMEQVAETPTVEEAGPGLLTSHRHYE